MLVTARAWHPSGALATRDWLNVYRIVVDEVVATRLGGKNLDYVAHLGPFFHAFIDDNVGNVRDAVDRKSVIRPMLISQPWNRNPTSEGLVVGYERHSSLSAAVQSIVSSAIFEPTCEVA